jgi:sRNA-binding protein
MSRIDGDPVTAGSFDGERLMARRSPIEHALDELKQKRAAMQQRHDAEKLAFDMAEDALLTAQKAPKRTRKPKVAPMPQASGQ